MTKNGKVRAGQVDLDHFPPQIQGERPVILDVADGTTVDEIVDGAELPRRVNEALYLVEFGNVTGTAYHTPADGADGSGGLFSVASAAGITEGDVGAFARQP
jgi:hypothetical protein